MNHPIRFLQINPRLFLIEQPVELPAPAKKQEPVNHLWIIDRSGSMYGQIGRVCKDLCEKVKKIPMDDLLSIGWFSSEGGNFRWVLKGYRVGGLNGVAGAQSAIERLNSTVALTCFSEILHDTSKVIEELSVISKLFSLCFFTDGYPVVSNLSRETNAIMDALTKIETRLVNAIFVGYGDYYNKELLERMAARAGGELIHCSKIESFSLNLDRLIDGAATSDGKVEVVPVVYSKTGDYFSLTPRGVALYSIDGAGKIRFSPGEQIGEGALYILADEVPDGAVEAMTSAPSSGWQMQSSFYRAAYAAASVLVNKMKTQEAIDLLAQVGDKHCIDLVTNAYTNAEYGRAEEELVTAVFKPDTRFKEGVVRNYVPPADAFCLLDLLDLLLEDPDAKFYPKHPRFDYKRIGPPARVKEGYPRFIPEDLVGVPINSLTWNDKKLNLSVLAKIPGKIDLGAEAEKYGFARMYPTFQYKNYALVKDGFLNVPVLPCNFAPETMGKLLKQGMLDSMGVSFADSVVLLKLDKIPIINRQIAEGRDSAEALFTLAWTELQHEASLKVFKFLRKEIDPEGTALLQTPWTEEQKAFLESRGINIKTGAYEPPVEKSEPTDKYFAKEIAVKIAGFSSLGKVDAARQKFVSGVPSDKVKGSDALFYPALAAFYGSPVATMDDKVRLQWLDERIAAQKKALFGVRSEIQRTKFAVVLAKKWFKEFSSRSDSTLEIGGQKYTLEVREVEVPI